MGFEQPAATNGRTEFDDGPLAGLVVVFRPAPIAAVDAATAALEMYQAADKVTPQLIAGMRPLAAELAQMLLAWNLEVAGQPVPTGQFLAQPAAFVFRVAERWMLELFDMLPQPEAEPGVVEADLPMESLPLVEAV